jgi:dihydrolipoyl dehydrogenase
LSSQVQIAQQGLQPSSLNGIEIDAVVIGSGPGGYVAAIRLGQLRKKVVLIERDRIGGVCLNVGCIPSKALITASKLVKSAKNADKMGISAQISVNLSKLQEWKQGVVNRLTSGVSTLCKANKVEIIMGSAKFLSQNELRVEKADGKTVRLGFKDAIIATGSSASDLPNVKFDGKRIISSTEALELRQIPRRMLLIGGGVIGLEIGMAYANLFGTELTIIEIMDQLLPGTDIELVNYVTRNLEKLSATIYLKAKVKSTSATEAGTVRVSFATAEGKDLAAEADCVLLGIGRRANTSNLGLDAIGVQLNERGFIVVDKQMRTSVPNIYAIGDVVGGPLLAHKASKEGIVAAEVISGQKSSADFAAMPSAIFTDPEIAIVGLSPSEARSQGFEISIGKFPFLASGRALTSGETDGFVKVVADKNSGLVLGIEIVGHESSDLISEGALAIEMGATVEDIGLTVHPHPTLPESLMEAAENVLGKAIHIQNREVQ